MAKMSAHLNLYQLRLAAKEGRLEEYVNKVNNEVLSSGETRSQRSRKITEAAVTVDKNRISVTDIQPRGFMDL